MLGQEIRVGDVILHATEWGQYVYRVRDDPDAHATLWVWGLEWGPDVKKNLGKKEALYVNVTALHVEEEVLRLAGLSE